MVSEEDECDIRQRLWYENLKRDLILAAMLTGPDIEASNQSLTDSSKPTSTILIYVSAQGSCSQIPVESLLILDSKYAMNASSQQGRRHLCRDCRQFVFSSGKAHYPSTGSRLPSDCMFTSARPMFYDDGDMTWSFPLIDGYLGTDSRRV